MGKIHNTVTITDMDGSHKECIWCKRRPPYGPLPCEHESFAEIRARKQREFDASMILGSPTNKSKERSVWPWWMVRIEELKAKVKELEQTIQQSEMH
jgi:hypothetical protein